MPRQSLPIKLQPAVLRWARERVSLSTDQLAEKMRIKPERVLEWERSGSITTAQADTLAEKTYTPLGYLYLSEPQAESLPIDDFRTRSGESLRRPSPNLLDTVYAMQRRQGWMRNEVIRQYEEPPLPFVGAFELTDDPVSVAEAMRNVLGISDGWAATVPNWSAALRHLRDKSEAAGILVVFNGVVGNNSHRKLDPKEFQGFALVDEHAPLVFVNNADFKAAQIFTLAHELAHVFVGETGLSHLEDMQPSDNETELFCDKTAAEFLVPERDLRAYWREANQTSSPYMSIARRFRVSSIVAARRALDLELTGRGTFFEFYNEYRSKEWRTSKQSKGGGNFWFNQIWRIGPRFATMVCRAVKEGRLTYTEAYSLTDLRGRTFENMPEELELSL